MDYPADSATTEGSVEKPPSRLGLGLLVAVAASGLALMLFSGGDPGSDEESASSVDDRPAVTTTVPVSTAMTLATGPDTVAGGDPATIELQQKLPDRGAFREALAATFVARCDSLIDGPEPIGAALYQEHGRCVTEALIGLDDRCKLAAAVFYVLPSEEALNVACDIEPEPQRFRESVRQSMVLACGLDREAGETEHEAYYEYDRCLQSISGELDEHCYLSARAQYLSPVDLQLREICEIPEGAVIDPSVE